MNDIRSGRRWYAIETRENQLGEEGSIGPGCAKATGLRAVASAVRGLGAKTFIGLEYVQVRRRPLRNREMAPRPAFGRFLLVEMDFHADDWGAIMRVDGVRRFMPLSAAMLPIPLPSRVVREVFADQAMRDATLEEVVSRASGPAFTPGQPVRIAEGGSLWFAAEGIVSYATASLVSMHVTRLGGEALPNPRLVEIRANQVEAA